MALYKYAPCVRQSDDPAFDAIHAPGTPALMAGVYQCHFCGHEIVVARDQVLPSENHHQHDTQAPVEWRLIVSLR